MEKSGSFAHSEKLQVEYIRLYIYHLSFDAGASRPPHGSTAREAGARGIYEGSEEKSKRGNLH